jgi:hypothetical protein
MSSKRAPSRVDYKVEVTDPAYPTVYSGSMPIPTTVVPLTPHMIYELPSSIYTIETNANEDFNLKLQLTRLERDGTETPVNLTGGALSFYIRPRFDHTALIKLLTIGDGIIVEDAINGLITLYMPEVDVRTDLLVTKPPANHWDYFLNFILGSGTTELFRGPFVVHAGHTN